jgi:hypothetical protein
MCIHALLGRSVLRSHKGGHQERGGHDAANCYQAPGRKKVKTAGIVLAIEVKKASNPDDSNSGLRESVT